jgi:hypothetical protein
MAKHVEREMQAQARRPSVSAPDGWHNKLRWQESELPPMEKQICKSILFALGLRLK